MGSSVILDVPEDEIITFQIFRTTGKMLWLSSEAEEVLFPRQRKTHNCMRKPLGFAFYLFYYILFLIMTYYFLYFFLPPPFLLLPLSLSLSLSLFFFFAYLPLFLYFCSSPVLLPKSIISLLCLLLDLVDLC